MRTTLGRLVSGAAAMITAALALAPTAWAQDAPSGTPAPSVRITGSNDPADDDDAGAPSTPFARVRYLDDAARILDKDGFTADAALNAPLYAGDELQTAEGHRAEVQFPDGTLVRLDGGTRLAVYAIAEPGERRTGSTLVGLSAGRVQVDVPEGSDGDEFFRLDAASGSIYPLERSAFRAEFDGDDTLRVSVARGQVEVAGDDGSVIVAAGQRTAVAGRGAPARAIRYNVMARDGFDAWVAGRDSAYRVTARPGREYDDLPGEVRPYYAELSRHGRWVYSDDFGWVWKPTDVDSDWRPYYRGEWADGPAGAVWVGNEPWGWATYRYGRWEWRVGLGWLWIPGSIFAPAHVYWYYGPSYVGWCPLGFWNRPCYYGSSWAWGDPWFDGCPWTFIGYDHFYWSSVPTHFVPRGHVMRPDLDRGIVSRRPFVPRTPRGHVAGDARTHLDRAVFDHARDQVGRDRTARPRPAIVRPGTQDPRPQVSFRDTERTVIERRIPPRAGGDRKAPDGQVQPGRTPRPARPEPRATPGHGGTERATPAPRHPGGGSPGRLPGRGGRSANERLPDGTGAPSNGANEATNTASERPRVHPRLAPTTPERRREAGDDSMQRFLGRIGGDNAPAAPRQGVERREVERPAAPSAPSAPARPATPRAERSSPPPQGHGTSGSAGKSESGRTSGGSNSSGASSSGHSHGGGSHRH